MDKQFLTDGAQITVTSAEVANGTSAHDSTGVDMSGYDNVCFVVEFGTAASNTTINAAQGSTLGGSYSDLADTEVASGSAETVILDIARPSGTGSFVRCEVTRGTSTTIASITTIRYNPREKIVDNSLSGESVIEKHAAPVAGTK